MIRAETPSDWILVTHPDHAHLAGQIADAWGNAEFDRPEPYAPIRYAVYHHDDGWLNRDANPSLTAAGTPEAFIRELVGAYSAFEEIDLPSYLQVREQATQAVTAVDLTEAVFVSMHSVNLLTEQVDVDTILPEHRAAHASFVAAQQAWQMKTLATVGLSPDKAQRGFEFLQCCDNLSLIVCSAYDQPRPLRHRHPDRHGQLHELQSTPLKANVWRISPWPFKDNSVEITLPRRRISKAYFTDLSSFRNAFAQTEVEAVSVILQKD
ncbi:MAG: DUF3891 family protein [Candidatus Synoicihabitans palmerolidicus]|nr:DUF3891 family protein [Candidatus Synoicihabitans palmerolidicus]